MVIGIRRYEGYLIMCVLWTIWQERNGKIFYGVELGRRGIQEFVTLLNSLIK